MVKKEISSKKYDIMIHSAAVNDYAPILSKEKKIKSGKSKLIIRLKPTIKIIDLIKKLDLAMSFDLPDNYFDGATANLVLTYIIHHEAELGLVGFTRLLEDIYKILKPGGKFIWSSPKKGVIFARVFLASWKDILNPRQKENLYYGPAILKQALRIQSWGKRDIYHFLDTKEIEKILKEIGFKNIKFSRSMANQVDIISCDKPR